MVLMTGQFIVALSSARLHHLEPRERGYCLRCNWLDVICGKYAGVIFIYFQGKSERLFQFLRKLQSLKTSRISEFYICIGIARKLLCRMPSSTCLGNA